MLPKGRSLKFYALLSWLVPGVLVIASCFLIIVGISLINYQSDIKRIEGDLFDKSNTVARRISAELLIGARGAVQSVSEQLKKEFYLSSVDVSSGSPKCALSADSVCAIKSNSKITVYRKIPFIASNDFIAISVPKPNLSTLLKSEILLWSILPIALMLGFGLFFQRIILRRYFLKPLQNLVETSQGNQEPNEYWPHEIREISDRLYQSFETRNKELFAQIARGVIHDLRTLIHTPLGAVDLVSEELPTSEKRLQRLEHLNSVCSRQLPKIKEIIDNTLDGSRDIEITPHKANIKEAVEGAASTLSSLLGQTKTELVVENVLDDEIMNYDKTQLERALTNLIKNGIEASQERAKTETSKQKLVSVTTYREKGFINIDIEDNGFGLQVGASKLFSPLKSTKVHGTGLGLIVSKKIIEAHGGKLIPGTSIKLGGAKFTISLPEDERGPTC